MKVKEVYHYLTVLSSWEDDVNSAMNNCMYADSSGLQVPIYF